jgi:hypothetical protein
VAGSFDRSLQISAKSFDVLRPLLAAKGDDGRYVTTDKGRLSRELQQSVGDVLMNINGEVYCIELKAEEKDYGNVFLEEWSNRAWYNRGWLDKLDTDFLWYHTLSVDRLLIIPFPRLRKWAFLTESHLVPDGNGRMYDFPCKPQCQYEQLNDTWGRCIPIEVIRREVGLKELHPLELLGATGDEQFTAASRH